MIKYTSGDMFAINADILVNTVNCVGVMGKGVALEFKRRFPAMYEDYRIRCSHKLIQPGSVSVWQTGSEWIINFPTKRHWRDNSLYGDITTGLRSLRHYLSMVGWVKVALPALGCGHGGLNWSRVRKLIDSGLDGLEAEITVFSPLDSRTLGDKTVITNQPD